VQKVKGKKIVKPSKEFQQPSSLLRNSRDTEVVESKASGDLSVCKNPYELRHLASDIKQEEHRVRGGGGDVPMTLTQTQENSDNEFEQKEVERFAGQGPH